MPLHSFQITQNIRKHLLILLCPVHTSVISRLARDRKETFNPYKKLIFKALICCLLLFISTTSNGANKLVIARNGAGSELIENSLSAIVLAASQNVQLLELQVNMSEDGELILFKDLTLNRMTDAAEIFPAKIRENGSFYVIDFTLAELQQLRIKNVFENDPNGLSFNIPTLRETLGLIQRLEDIFNHSIGITIEPIEPQYYLENTYDISESIIDTLISFGYSKNKDNLVFIQSSDSDELQRIHSNILPAKQVIFPLIQLVKKSEEDINDPETLEDRQLFEHDWFFTNTGLRHIASYAGAIALPDSLIFSTEGKVLRPKYLENIKKYGLKILISSTDLLQAAPRFVNNFPALLNLYYDKIMADGIYTDDYLAVQQHNRSLTEQARRKAELPEFFSNLNLTLPAPKEDNLTFPIDPEDNLEE